MQRLGEDVCELIFAGDMRKSYLAELQLLFDVVKGDGHVLHPRVKYRVLCVECSGDVITEDSGWFGDSDV